MNKKIWILKAILPGLLFAIITTAKGAARLPEELVGNWLRTDGSNQFVIGLYPDVVCYRNNTWVIISTTGDGDHLQLKLQNDSAFLDLDLQRKDAHTIVLSENGHQHTLKNIRTYNYRYKPQQHSFKHPLFTLANATLKGCVHWPENAGRISGNNYIQVSYKNMFTGEVEYFYAPLDSLQRFNISFPVYKFQRCTLSQGRIELTSFFVQPGDTLLIAINKTVGMREQNPDYNKLTQRVSAMGSDEDFNNLYQHYLWHNRGADLPGFPQDKSKGSSEIKASKKTFYRDLYLQRSKAIEHVYTPARAERRFIDYMKDEVRYACADALLSALNDRYSDDPGDKADSADMKHVHQAFLAGATPLAFLHDGYYRVAAKYGKRLDNARYGHSRNYRISPGKADERIRKEYAPLLSKEFMRAYDSVSRNFAKIQNMSDEAIIQQYFHGSREAAVAFRYVYDQIADQLFTEVADSITYTLYKQEIGDPFLRFAASLQRLLDPSSSDDLGIPSTFRLKLFRSFCDIPGTPFPIVDTLNMAQAFRLAGVGLQARFDGSLLKDINNEANWQAELKRYRGKVVVVWGFSHYFEKEHAQRSLYELKQMEELYHGKNVVFLKCIQQRQRSDKVKVLLGYLRMMKNNDALNNILYMDRSVSAMALLSDGIDSRCGIYDTAGQLHHPGPYYTSGRQWRGNITLQSELDAVLAGKVNEYESTADRIFSAALRGNSYSSYRPVNTWTRYKAVGPYLVFASKEPEKPDTETEDSVFNQISFYGDTIYREHQLALRKMEPPKDDNSIFYSYKYRKEFIPGEFGGPYQYNRDKRLLSIYDNKRKLYKQFRVVTITTDLMVLEQLQE